MGLWGLVILASLVLYLIKRNAEFLFIPAALLAGAQLLVNYRPLFYLLIFSIPFSVQLEFGPLSMDLPDEPLMILLSMIFIFEWVAGKVTRFDAKGFDFRFWLFILICWWVITTLNSSFPFRSGKFLLAKLWYLGAFVYMASQVLTDMRHIRILFWTFLISFTGVVLFVTFRHAAEGFSYGSSHGISYPFFANGVIYGATLALFLPFIWLARSWYPHRPLLQIILWICAFLFLFNIVMSYKRAAWLATASLPFISLLLHRKWFRPVVYASLATVFLLILYLVRDNAFYQFEPNYQQTVWHEDDLGGHLEATVSGKELSGVERFYRWVAAKNMIAENPYLGFGPSTFNQVYKQYTDDAFRTYVSDNPEQSTTHNYFLMTFSEQGIFGGLLFIGLCVYMMVKATKLYHTVQHRDQRVLVKMALLSLCTIVLHSILNELIEVDKVGAMFWLNFVFIHKVDQWHGESVSSEEPS